MTAGLAGEYTGCASARLAVSLVLDCEAEGADVHRVVWHLRTCASCRRFACEVAALTWAVRLHAAEPRRTAGSDEATERPHVF